MPSPGGSPTSSRPGVSRATSFIITEFDEQGCDEYTPRRPAGYRFKVIQLPSAGLQLPARHRLVGTADGVVSASICRSVMLIGATSRTRSPSTFRSSTLVHNVHHRSRTNRGYSVTTATEQDGIFTPSRSAPRRITGIPVSGPHCHRLSRGPQH